MKKRIESPRLKPIMKYPGAKWRLASWIVSHFPTHAVYLEPFFGSGAVLFNKAPAVSETVNDIDDDIVNLFRIVRDRKDELIEKVRLTPWARAEWKASYAGADDEIERARRFLVRAWQSYGAKLGTSTGWSRVTKAMNGQYLKRWAQLPQRIELTCKRLANVQIEHGDAIDLIQTFNAPDVLIYADPPYMQELRVKGIYRHDMDTGAHVRFLEAIRKHSGFAVVSGYESELYADYLTDWSKHTRDARSTNNTIKTEVIWINPFATETLREHEVAGDSGKEQITILDALASSKEYLR